jgi:hypothetical protein
VHSVFFDFAVAALQTGFAKLLRNVFQINFHREKKSGQTYRGRSSYFELVFPRSNRKRPRQLPARAVSGVVMGETF